jgi:uncharacterized protein (DUF2147 family)
MKTGLSVTSGLTALFLLSGSALADTAEPMGNWARGDGAAKVKVAPCGANICATNTWIKQGNGSEKAGDVLVMTLKPESTGSFKGTAFDPQRNMNFRMTLNVKGDSMTTRGCVLGGIICKSVSWSRID